MNLKQLQLSQDIYNQLTELDASIKELGHKASSLANKEQIVKLSLEFETQLATPKEESHEDEAFEAMMDSLGPLRQFIKKKPQESEKKETAQFTLSDTETLEVFAILLHIKNEQKKKLINQLSELGLELK